MEFVFIRHLYFSSSFLVKRTSPSCSLISSAYAVKRMDVHNHGSIGIIHTSMTHHDQLWAVLLSRFLQLGSESPVRLEQLVIAYNQQKSCIVI